MDANLAPALAARVRAAGYDCIHVTEILAPDADDREIATEANRLGAALITKDADFIDLSDRGVLQGALIWLKSGNMSNRQKMRLLLPALPEIVARIGAGDRVIELR
jgi:predicted nuclease of predicted toxin-antitoxin system